jgi:hypothetical protein
MRHMITTEWCYGIYAYANISGIRFKGLLIYIHTHGQQTVSDRLIQASELQRIVCNKINMKIIQKKLEDRWALSGCEDGPIAIPILFS